MKGRKRQILRAALVLALACEMGACSSTSSRAILDERQNAGKPHAAAYAAEGFTLDHRSPDPRPYQPWEFYYKNCSLVSRNPYPTRSEYSCNDPH